jgi:hypothetical protein
MECVGALLLVAVGCIGRSFPAPNPAYKQVVNDTPSHVATLLKEGLSNAGVNVLVKQHPSEVRLVGQATPGKIFCLYVRSGKTADGEKTVVSVYWDRQPDEKLWQTVVNVLTESEQEDDGSTDEP